MMATGGEVEFGKRLRAAAERMAETAAKRAVEQGLAPIGGDIEKWAAAAADRAARQAVAELAKDLLPETALNARSIAKVESAVEAQARALAAIDRTTLQATYDEIQTDISRLRKQRAELAADLKEVSGDLDIAKRAAEEATKAVRDMIAIRDRMAAEIDTVAKAIGDRVREIAASEVDTLRADSLALAEDARRLGVAFAKIQIDRFAREGKATLSKVVEDFEKRADKALSPPPIAKIDPDFMTRLKPAKDKTP